MTCSHSTLKGLWMRSYRPSDRVALWGSLWASFCCEGANLRP